jgi:hypothetical protein
MKRAEACFGHGAEGSEGLLSGDRRGLRHCPAAGRNRGAVSAYPEVFGEVAAAAPEPRTPLILLITIACNLGTLSMLV